ncbi:MAG TPA: hypothetical protein VM487_24305, partial [Phycisphaerae bacterium]|nr:hypothetical protein [Phycisphaerae bacterium]
PDYALFRDRVTKKVVSEADSDATNGLKEDIIFDLVISLPSASSELGFEYEVKPEDNAKLYEMREITEALKRWRRLRFSRQAEEAMNVLFRAYGIEGVAGKP